MDSPIHELLTSYEAPLVSKELLEQVHTKTHIDGIFNKSPKQGLAYIDGDTQMNPHTLQAARRAAGAGVKAVDLVMQGEIDRAFCNVRPPGHHAEKDTAMGFCFFNNIAVAAKYALSFNEINRVAIVDFDVHHGNGTEDIFEEDEKVMLLSSFQHPLYPGWDESEDGERIIHTPLKQGAATETLCTFFNEDWLERLEAFKPDFIFISAGFDAHHKDPLGGLKFKAEDYEWMTAQIVELAHRICKGRVVSMLEGGYSLEALKESSVAHLKGLVGAGLGIEQDPKKKVIEAKPALRFSQPDKPKQSPQKGMFDLSESQSLSYFHKASLW